MRPDPQVYADVLILALKTAMAPVLAKNQSLQDQIATFEGRCADIAAMRERIAALEARPPVPGPPGEPGPPGRDGVDGAPGKPGLEFEGVYQDGKSYDRGHLVTFGGSSWHCNEATTTKPGDGSKAWTLMVKRGRDGKDGKA
jgi:hypothetical protein